MEPERSGTFQHETDEPQFDFMSEYGNEPITIFGITGLPSDLLESGCPVDKDTMTLGAKNDFLVRAMNESGSAIKPEHVPYFNELLAKDKAEPKYTIRTIDDQLERVAEKPRAEKIKTAESETKAPERPLVKEPAKPQRQVHENPVPAPEAKPVIDQVLHERIKPVNYESETAQQSRDTRKRVENIIAAEAEIAHDASNATNKFELPAPAKHTDTKANDEISLQSIVPLTELSQNKPSRQSKPAYEVGPAVDEDAFDPTTSDLGSLTAHEITEDSIGYVPYELQTYGSVETSSEELETMTVEVDPTVNMSIDPNLASTATIEKDSEFIESTDYLTIEDESAIITEFVKQSDEDLTTIAQQIEYTNSTEELDTIVTAVVDDENIQFEPVDPFSIDTIEQATFETDIHEALQVAEPTVAEALVQLFTDVEAAVTELRLDMIRLTLLPEADYDVAPLMAAETHKQQIEELCIVILKQLGQPTEPADIRHMVDMLVPIELLGPTELVAAEAYEPAFCPYPEYTAEIKQDDSWPQDTRDISQLLRRLAQHAIGLHRPQLLAS